MEVLVATAAASVVLAGVAGLLGVSAQAVSDSEMETTATWLASRTIEEWRSSAVMPAEGARAFDRDGRMVDAGGLYVVRWSARSEPGTAGVWRVSVSAAGPRMREATTLTALVPASASRDGR